VTAFEQIAHVANVPMELDVQLGQSPMTVEAILALDAGSVIKLPRSAGENIDIMAGGALIASGEIVVIEESYGVRITDFAEET
jgi:flagellar motor switch protein FliN/FliY